METAFAHLLLIDDAPDELAQLVAFLRKHNLKITFAESARQGYQLAMTIKPDLILLDLFMPVMDGFAICRRLQETPCLKVPPIIFLSSANSLEDRLKGFELGGVDFITKPFAAKEVLARIKVHLQHRRVQQVNAPSEQPPPPQDEEEIILNAALRLISEDLAAPPSLEGLAKAVGTHEKRLLRIFRERLDTTVFAYIREARQQKARELLANRALSVESISAIVGFSSSANFATAFKAYEGVTPTEYRHRLKRLQSDACL